MSIGRVQSSVILKLSSLEPVFRPQPTQQRSRERVDAIYEATRVLLREGGVERCTIAAIAAQAEITPASIYRYFPDATSIVRSLAELSLDHVHEMLKQLLTTITSADQIPSVLNAALDSYADFFASDRSLRELWFGSLADAQLLELNIADSRRNAAMIAEALAPFTDTPLGQLKDRWFLLSQMIGSAVGLLLDVSPSEAKRLRRELNHLVTTMLTDG
jgi:AcrR family transcriptional regulator